MAEFVIRLADERGRLQEQVQTAASAEELRARFTQAGYYVYSVKARGLRNRQKKIKLEGFLIFNQQFLTLIRAGVPILPALEMLSKSQKNLAFRSQLESVTQRIRTGQSPSEAFEAQGGFPADLHHDVAGRRAQRASGRRAGALSELPANFADISQEAAGFDVLPGAAGDMVLSMFTFLITFVVPRFGQLYDQIGGSLPPLTMFLLALGKNFQAYILYAIPVIALLAYVLWRWSRTEEGGNRIDRIRLKMPIFGNIWVKYQVAQFSRTLSTLLEGGMPPVPSLETAARSIASRVIGKAVRTSVTSVREGKPLSLSLTQTRVFPELATSMIEVGESTGALPQMLNSVAEFFEEDVQTALTAALSLIEPIILIVMGIVVVTIMIALYLPIFSLGQAGSMGGR